VIWCDGYGVIILARQQCCCVLPSLPLPLPLPLSSSLYYFILFILFCLPMMTWCDGSDVRNPAVVDSGSGADTNAVNSFDAVSAVAPVPISGAVVLTNHEV
jgi:hypothetical protein